MHRQLSQTTKDILHETQDGFVELIKTPTSPSWSLLNTLLGTNYKYQYKLYNNRNKRVHTKTITCDQYDRSKHQLDSEHIVEFLISKSKHHIIKSITLQLPFPAHKIKRCVLRLNDYFIDIIDTHILSVFGLLDQTTFMIPLLDHFSIPNLILQLQEVVLHLEFYENILEYKYKNQITYTVESRQHDPNYVPDMFLPQLGGPFLFKTNDPFNIKIPNKFLCCEPQKCVVRDLVFVLNRSKIHTIQVSLQSIITKEFIDINTVIQELVVLDSNQKIMYIYKKDINSSFNIKILLNQVDEQDDKQQEYKHLTVSIKCKQSNPSTQICVFGIYEATFRCMQGQLYENLLFDY